MSDTTAEKLPKDVVKSNERKFDKHGHLVQFYEDDSYLLRTLIDFIKSAIAQDNTCLVIGTREHLNSVENQLKQHDENIDLKELKETGQYVSMDANVTLSQFMKSGIVDEEVFNRTFTEILKKMEQRDRPIVAFSEMVAILWDHGNDESMIQLEDLWNLLSESHKFTLYCGYPLAAFDHAGDGAAFMEITKLHSEVIPGESFDAFESELERSKAIATLQQKSEALATAKIEIERLSKLDREKDEIIAIASHELRSPASGVKLYISMLLDGYAGDLTSEQQKLLSSANLSNDRQVKIVDELLNTSKIEAGVVTLKLAASNLVDMIKSVVSEHKLEIQKQKLKVELKLPEHLIAYVDEHYMRTVLVNLFDNAIKYSTAGKTITITARETDSKILIEFIDEGIGIRSEDQDLLFRKFSRVKSKATTGIQGTGLGLYWTKMIAELHGGAINLKSDIGKGSKFTISFPSQN